MGSRSERAQIAAALPDARGFEHDFLIDGKVEEIKTVSIVMTAGIGTTRLMLLYRDQKSRLGDALRKKRG
jgi:hypothetical protein